MLKTRTNAHAAAEDGAAAPADDGPRQRREGRRGAHWLAIAAILTTDMVGIGTLGLPADFARLGWLPALACLALFVTGGVYSGSVYQRLSLAVPDAVVFDEIGSAGGRVALSRRRPSAVAGAAGGEPPLPTPFTPEKRPRNRPKPLQQWASSAAPWCLGRST
jgi:hypothetical protein